MSDDIVIRAALATAGLAKCFSSPRHFEDGTTRDALVLLLRNHWKALKYWLRYFTQYYKVPESIDPELLPQYDRESSPESLTAKLFWALTNSGVPEIEKVVSNDPFVFKLLVVLWFHQGDTIPSRCTSLSSKAWCRETSPYTSAALALHMRRKTPYHIEEMLKVVNGDHTFLAVSAIQRLNFAITAGVQYLMDVQMHADLVYTLTISHNEGNLKEMVAAMCENKVCVIVPKALLFLARHHDKAVKGREVQKKDEKDEEDETYLEDILIRGYGCMSLLLVGPIPTARQAIRAGLLDSIALLTPTKYMDEHEEGGKLLLATLVDMLAVSLPHQTITYHVLDDMINACGRFSRDGLKLLSEGNGPLAMAWNTLRMALCERHVVQCIHDRDRAMLRIQDGCDIVS